jgi:hypothetical protein
MVADCRCFTRSKPRELWKHKRGNKRRIRRERTIRDIDSDRATLAVDGLTLGAPQRVILRGFAVCVGLTRLPRPETGKRPGFDSLNSALPDKNTFIGRWQSAQAWLPTRTGQSSRGLPILRPKSPLDRDLNGGSAAAR